MMKWTECNIDGGTFFQGDPTSLERTEVTMVTQALDNQWLPKEILDKKPKSLIEDGVFEERNGFVRREFLRSLLNAKHLVANRAFLFNNHSIFAFYKEKDSEQEMFRRLLSERAVIPFLFNEQSPFIRRDVELKATEPIFGFLPDAFDKWQDMCRDAKPSCLRLAWPSDGDDRRNTDLITRHLAKVFHEFGVRAQYGQFDVYASHLGIDETKKKDFATHLHQIAGWFHGAGHDDAGNPKFRTRNELYTHFLVQPNSNTSHGRLDWNRPWVSEVKRLFDLRYNVNLADAIGRFAITPPGSPPRVALQESTLQNQTAKSETSAEQMIEIVRRTLADSVQRNLDMPLLDHILLADVYGVRQEKPWNDYISSFSKLIQSVGPEIDLATSVTNLGQNIHQVFEQYGKVAGALADIARRRHVDYVAAKVRMSCGFMIDIAGIALAFIAQTGAKVHVEIYQDARERILAVLPANGIATLVVRLFFKDPTRNDILELQADLIQRRLPNARVEIDKILRDLGLIGARERPQPTAAEQEANVNFIDEVDD